MHTRGILLNSTVKLTPANGKTLPGKGAIPTTPAYPFSGKWKTTFLATTPVVAFFVMWVTYVFGILRYTVKHGQK